MESPEKKPRGGRRPPLPAMAAAAALALASAHGAAGSAGSHAGSAGSHAGSAARPGAIRAVEAFGKRYLLLEDVARHFNMALLQAPEGVRLSGRGRGVTLAYDRREGFLDGVKIHFLNAPALVTGVPLVSEKDFWLVLTPLLRDGAAPRHPMGTILLDPGHGGHDTGARGAFRLEKDVTLAIARKARDRLAAMGYKVRLTRNGDGFVELSDRPAMGAGAGGDLFISIHCNSAPPGIRGIESYALAPVGVEATNGGRAAAAPEPGNANDKANIRLAYELHRALLAMTGAPDRGVRHSRFAVLKNATDPAALLEVGFISSPQEERLLATPAYQDRIAKAIANGVYAYHRAMLKGAAASPVRNRGGTPSGSAGTKTQSAAPPPPSSVRTPRPAAPAAAAAFPPMTPSTRAARGAKAAR